MSDMLDVFRELYRESRTEARHQEEQRTSMTNFTIAVSAGLLGVVALDEKIDKSDWPPALFIILLGMFGALFSAKYHERFSYFMERSRAFRTKIEELVPDTNVKTIIKEAGDRTKQSFPWMYKLRADWFWVLIHILITVIGILVGYEACK
jgi:hypothetical protein